MSVGRAMIVKHAFCCVQDLMLLDAKRRQLCKHVVEVAVRRL